MGTKICVDSQFQRLEGLRRRKKSGEYAGTSAARAESGVSVKRFIGTHENSPAHLVRGQHGKSGRIEGMLEAFACAVSRVIQAFLWAAFSSSHRPGH
jgi:hypothetical protein